MEYYFSFVFPKRKLFIKKFDNDLCNNLINDLNKFISKENLQKINKLSVSIGPANFNASRLIVVLARTIAQQINCPLDSFSSFEIMAKRIASKNNILKNKTSFWIFKNLKRKGFIAGKYEICCNEKNSSDLIIRETILPKVVKKLESKELSFEATYDDKKDLKENKNLSITEISKITGRARNTIYKILKEELNYIPYNRLVKNVNQEETNESK